jgi:hypothetical protein
MSETVQGVDLSNYSSIEKNVTRAGERTWEAISNWLVKAFSVDLEHQNMLVMALINKSAPVYWKLVALEGTPRWRSFIRNACRVGLPVILFVQVYQKGGSSSQVHEEAKDVDEGGDGEEGEGAKEGEQQEEEEGEQQEKEERVSEGEHPSRGYVVTGVIDAVEVNPEVMRQYQRELEADERALEEDSSDDDYDDDGDDEDDDDDDDDESEDHVPLHWRNYDFSRCTVNSGENVPWKYMENEVCEGAMYPSTAHLKDAVK